MKLRTHTSIPFALLLIVWLAVTVPSAWAVELSVHDTVFQAGDTLRMPIYADMIEPTDSLFAFQFTFSFDSLVLTGVGASAAGTISEPFGDPFTSRDALPGMLRVAAAGIHPISGSGPLVNLLLRASSQSGGASMVRFDTVLFNEGWPVVTYTNPLATITVEGLSVGDPQRLPRGHESGISVSPNPARDRVTIEFPAQAIGSRIQVWNVLGRQVRAMAVTGSRVNLVFSDLPGGVYFITVADQPKLTSRIMLMK